MKQTRWLVRQTAGQVNGKHVCGGSGQTGRRWAGRWTGSQMGYVNGWGVVGGRTEKWPKMGRGGRWVRGRERKTDKPVGGMCADTVDTRGAGWEGRGDREGGGTDGWVGGWMKERGRERGEGLGKRPGRRAASQPGRQQPEQGQVPRADPQGRGAAPT